MSKKRVMHFILIAGVAATLALSVEGSAEEIRDPIDPSQVITPLEPDHTAPSTNESADSTTDSTVEETTESTSEKPTPKPVPKPDEPKKEKKTEHKKVWLNQLFDEHNQVAPNGSGGGNDDQQAVAYMSELAGRLAGKTLIGRRETNGISLKGLL